MRASTGHSGETRWVNGETRKESTEPGVSQVEVPVYNPLFLVQSCAGTPLSERSLFLTCSGGTPYGAPVVTVT